MIRVLRSKAQVKEQRRATNKGQFTYYTAQGGRGALIFVTKGWLVGLNLEWDVTFLGNSLFNTSVLKIANLSPLLK